MFIRVSTIPQAAHPADGLQNPKNPGHPMALRLYRTHSAMAIVSVYSKKVFSEYWDDTENKKIPNRLWTTEMKAFAAQKMAEVPKAPYFIKITVLGWIFVLLIVASIGYSGYKSLNPKTVASSGYAAMVAPPVAGDIYFGHFEAYNKADEQIPSGLGYGWFKVVKVEGDIYHIAKSTEMSKSSQPKNQLNNTHFEEGTTASKSIGEGYIKRFKAVDGSVEFYFMEKK